MPSGICARCGLYSKIHLLWETETSQWICPDCFRFVHGWAEVPLIPCWRCRMPIRADLMFNQRGKVVCRQCRSIMRQMELLEAEDRQKKLEGFA